LSGIFGKGGLQHLLDFRGKIWQFMLQRGWRYYQVFSKDFDWGAIKGKFAAEPFVDDHCQGILIGGRARMLLNLFRSHIRRCASKGLTGHGRSAMSNGGNAKIGEHNLAALIKQHIFWFHIAMDQFFFMGVVQRQSKLFNIGDNHWQRHTRSPWITLTQRASGMVVHD
jgi:hypothetical protein